MFDELEAVLLANDRFYRALSLADAALMRKSWVESTECTCVHPGWQPIQGFNDIQRSWQSIFQSQGLLRIWATDEQVEWRGELGIITCIEHIDVSATQPGRVAQAEAINIFSKVGGQWKMFHHSATALLGQTQLPVRIRLANN